jgi:L-2-hydroxycarboxylate dehydrogenase (NAD+)
VKITATQAEALATRLLEEHDASPANAHLQAALLIDAELKGHPSHGLQRLPRILSRIDRGLIDPRANGISHWQSDAVLRMDGQKGLGPVVAMSAVEQLMRRVVTSGIALAAIRNSNHLGMLAFYVERLALHGLIGIAMSSSEALVHPFGGTRAVLGTNPIAIAVPTSERPLILDLATSVVSMGKIHHYAHTKMPLPSGWARDLDGNPTTDPHKAKAGAIAPFGDAKGYGLGIAVELLVAALAGSALAPDVRGTLDADSICNKGDVIIAIDPGGGSPLLQTLADYLELVRISPPANLGKPVSIPGDGAHDRREASMRHGFEITGQLWSELNALSLSAALDPHSNISLEGYVK